jgi:hypothetical protein
MRFVDTVVSVFPPICTVEDEVTGWPAEVLLDDPELVDILDKYM